MNVIIIGAGRIGSAIKYVCEKNSTHHIELCDTDATKAPQQKPLTETIPTADVIFLCTQSFAVRALLAQLSPLLPAHALVISATKGIERNTLKTMDVVLSEGLPAYTAWGILIGPTLAEEIVAGQGSAAVIASNQPDRCVLLRELIDPCDMSIECSHDVHGVALAGVLKNVYAFGCGIADGIGWGMNRKGWLIARALEEMHTALGVLGGDAATALGVAGLGDLVATGCSPHSRNRTSGEQLAQTGEFNPLAEGYISIVALQKMLGDRARELPLLCAIAHVIEDWRSARTTFESLV